MPAAFDLLTDHSLRSLNTFGIDAKARAYVRITDLAQLDAVLDDPQLAAMPRLVLGGGSNLVLTGDYDGLVLHMALEGREVLGVSGERVLVRGAAGENWHGFVRFTLEAGLGGLENLSLIPGTLGAAPIQNIGAYGTELKDVFASVEVFDMATRARRTLDGAACRFAYRDSLFKHAEGARLLVTSVTLALPRAWQPNLRYAELAKAVEAAGLVSPTPTQISDLVIGIRQRKLPDPAVIGNAGSFFKNPVVDAACCARLLAAHPDLVHYPQPDGTEKLAAGWLIDRCGWKGRSMGPAGVYEKQALVLVNRGGARGEDVVRLAEAIQADVMAKFGVALEPEPVFV
jgi:UDP-N-acetylmuramate dehydrogenase